MRAKAKRLREVWVPPKPLRGPFALAVLCLAAPFAAVLLPAALLGAQGDPRDADAPSFALQTGTGRTLDAASALLPSFARPDDGALGSAPRDFRLVGASGPTELVQRRQDGNIARRMLLNPAGGQSPWIRPVLPGDTSGDPSRRILPVHLGDTLAFSVGEQSLELPVGRPGGEDGPMALREARLRIRIVHHPGLRTAQYPELNEAALRREVARANAIWSQCAIGFGPADDADVALLALPRTGAPFLSIGDDAGIQTVGGFVQFQVGDVAIRVDLAPGLSPAQSAERIAAAGRAAGFDVRVGLNPRVRNAAAPSADVAFFRDGERQLLHLDDHRPLTNESAQSILLAPLRLGNGLTPFRTNRSAAGTLEERALLAFVSDDDPQTIDVAVIARFAFPRNGEAFIESDGGRFANSVIVSHRGVANGEATSTLAHELGHVLLDTAFHTDDRGADRPWLLMDGNAFARGSSGPRRLSQNECREARLHSGIGATPALLRRSDVR